jgi:carbon starvation protein
MIISEAHIKPIATGAMLVEGIVSILALIAAASLNPLDYFQINVSPEKFAQILPHLQSMGFTVSDIQQLTVEVGENVIGRTGGAVSLAVGMAQIFSAIPGLNRLMSYWYHFAIMFEALFILTTIDAGTRIGRFILQEALGKIYKPFASTHWLPGNLIASGFIVFTWAYFIYTGSVSTIWPMFGSANQLLAGIALVVGTTYIINRGRAKYAWVTIIPMVFVILTTLTACFTNITNIYYPQLLVSKTMVQGTINLVLTGIIMTCAIVIIFDAVPKWIKTIKGERALFSDENNNNDQINK